MATLTNDWPAFLSAEVAADPNAFYRRLRAESPVHWDEGLGGYLLSRHADVGAAYRDPAFSTRNYEERLEPVFGRSLLQMDGSEHSRKRALVTPYFRGKGLTKWEPVIARNIAAILDRSVVSASDALASRFRPGDTVDLLAEFGNYLPVYVITDMLGLPHADYGRFFAWYSAHIDFLGNLARDPRIDARGRAATAELWEYLTPIIAQRRAEPGEDLISALVVAEIDGETLDDIEVCTHVTQILNAGSETTGKALASMFTHLLEQRDLFEAVRDDRSNLTPAISETLRLSPPSQMNGRQTAAEVQIEGVSIPPGSLVMLLMASANRDERRFANPDSFDPSRTDLNHEKAFTASGDHFAFGFGRHFCLGAMLAKSELEQSSSVLLDRFPDMRFAGGRVPTWAGLKMRSVESLQVTL
ncbi:cytochrome P450 [Pseudonocardia petroleophila]|uniref:Cytochrome P450 n=1 Tax=Pseudonocardia petroleophila TaxID=37331 RepID=A0A7G7MCI5_9PSEU|nr:cytochrome P450 [Pseudonocardia petroleophila]QNG50496.1 cytochrome P450 [Pseudonocardia petroleophila]